jgi:Uma2 family endonuclease
MSVRIARHTFTVAEYRRMGETGILTENDRVELIEGEIVKMSPIGKRHAACVGWLNRTLTLLLQHVALVWSQNPLELDDYSEPQPDVVVLKPREDFYRNARPKPEDVLLVIEVSDSTLAYDRQIKTPLYARAGVPEVWIVNLSEERVETFAEPSDGVYGLTASYSRDEEVQSSALCDLKLAVSDILG